jgi:hypothetical protein
MVGTVEPSKHIGRVWIVTGTVVVLAVGIAFTVTGYSQADFDVAYLCFVISAGAIMMATVFSLVWSSWPTPLRMIATAVIFAIVGVLLVESLLWVARRKELAEKAARETSAGGASAVGIPSAPLTTVTEPDDITDPSRRVFIDSSVIKQLLTPPAHLTSAQKDAFRKSCVRKWIRVAGVVEDVQQSRIELVSTEHITGDATMHLEFDKAKLKEFQLLERGQPVTLVGRIYIADGSFVVIRHCEPVITPLRSRSDPPQREGREPSKPSS